MRATAILGAGFGDEGKGRTVDALSDKDTLVVRFNGGSQAGHTVQVGNVRHVFSHFGSGTFRGAWTYLSRFFVVDPVTFCLEWKELEALGLNPKVTVDHFCPLTTPYERAVNQALERSRGVGRHGSCGVGFGETVERESRKERLLVGGTHRLEGAREHAIKRLVELGLSTVLGDVIREADSQVSRWFDCLEFMGKQTLGASSDILRGPGFSSVVFEGAQGLLLDQDRKFYFPHVTRSKTGLHNVKILAKEAGIDELRAVYVTRSYLTRHGAGPLPREDVNLTYEDPTNKPAEFQGSLRFASLQPEYLFNDIWEDSHGAAEVFLAVTCLDQFGGLLWAHEIEEKSKIPVAYCGYGPERAAFLERKVADLYPQRLYSQQAARM